MDSSVRCEIRSCPTCGEDMVRKTRRRIVRYKRRSVEIRQPGWWCRACGEGVLDPKDSVLADRAFATLKARDEGVLDPATIQRIRARLKLTQRKAGKILGGGARAFQRYEAGAVVVSRPMSNLLTLLDEHPALLSRLAAQSAKVTRQRPPAKQR
ncbi:MAG: type II toxin-antitoxin system MqsA family antitoxin [bacterium]